MDRPLDPEFVRRRGRRRAVLGVAAVSLLAAGYAGGPALLRPSVDRARVRIATVDQGPVEASLSASGLVLPATEQVVVSPVDARVLAVVRHAGDTVAPGDVLVQLDLAASRLDVDKLGHAVALQHNAQRRAQLDLQRSLADLDARREIKVLQHAQLGAALQRTRALAAEGLVAAETLQAAELAEKQAAIELRQLDAETVDARERARAELDRVALETASAQGDLEASRRRLEQASLRADHGGALTWVVAEPGAMVRAGEPVARLADLGSFRIQATAADVHARTLVAGQRARVRAGESVLDGTVTAVEPAIREGVVTFWIALADPRAPQLRSNQRVDVFVVTGHREHAVRLERGPGVDAGTSEVFVVQGGEAQRRPVQVGLVGFDRVEVVQGLVTGDEVVVSDMSAWRHAPRLKLR